MPASAFRLLASGSLVLLLIAAPLHAGEVRGRIVDPDGRAVPGADVLLTVGSSVHTRTVSDADGRFVLDGPDRGDAVVRVAIAGFRAAPLHVSAGPEPRDLGTIALAISAVSEAVVVSAAQVEVPLSSTASSVTVLTGEELQRRQLESVADALRLVPGLHVVASGGRGAVTSLFPRGGESDYSLVFVDGVQLNSFGGGLDLAHLPIVNIDRIEIVRGPQSALYGSNAIGSVVRIVTRRGGPPSAAASLEGGGDDTFRAAAAAAGERGNWQWGALAERLVSGGQNGLVTSRGETVTNDDYERHTLSGALGWRDANGATVRSDVKYSFDDRGFPGPFGSDPGGTYPGLDSISRGEDNRWLLSAGAGVPLRGARLTADIAHARLDGEFVSPSFIDGSPTTSESWTRRTSGRVQLDGAFGRGLEGTAGFELLGESAGGTFITATGNRPVPVERSLAGFFGEARWSHAARLFLNAGLRVERITREALEGEADAFTPRPPFAADTVVSANPKVSAAWFARTGGGGFTKIRGAAGTGIRPPDAFEIAFTDNPSLKPERSRSFEAGIDHAFLDGLALVEATAFLSRYDDLIVATGSFTGTSEYRTDNISNARSAGLEVAGTARHAFARGRASLQAHVSYTYLDTEILAVDSSSDAPPPFSPGDALLRRPTHQFSVDVRVDAGRFSGFIGGGGRSRVVDVDPSFGTFGGLFELAGYSAWNAGASWHLHRRLEIFGRVTNLFDRAYEEVLGFPLPGRSAIAGVRVVAGR